MPNPYLTHEIAQLTQSHGLSLDAMERAAKEQGDQGIRCVQLFTQLAAMLSTEERTEAGTIVYTRSLAAWNESKVHEAAGLDATAAALGTTRAALLAELAAVPATNFG
jgi:hypothetical protein